MGLFWDMSLSEAAYQGNLSAVKYCIYRQMDTNESDELSAMTPLHLAARRGHVEVVNALLQTPGVIVNARDSWNGSALHGAAAEGHIRVVKALCETKGIDINIVNNFLQTPLDLANKYKRSEVIKYLKDRGALVRDEDHVGAPYVAPVANCRDVGEGIKVTIDKPSWGKAGKIPWTKVNQIQMVTVESILSQGGVVELLQAPGEKMLRCVQPTSGKYANHMTSLDEKFIESTTTSMKQPAKWAKLGEGVYKARKSLLALVTEGGRDASGRGIGPIQSSKTRLGTWDTSNQGTVILTQ